MTAIDVGNPAIDQAYSSSMGYTFVELTNPCNATGKITTVEVYVQTAGNFKVGIVTNAAWSAYYVRSVADLGWLALGYHSIGSLDLDCVAGDYIAFYSANGRLDKAASGGSGRQYKQADVLTQGDVFDTLHYDDEICSIYGTGGDVLEPPNEAAIHETLEGVLSDYNPAVGTWFNENFFLREDPDFIVAAILYMADTIAGGAPSGPSNQDVLDAIADLDTHLSTVATTLNLAIVTRHDQTDALIGTPPVDLYTSLGVAEGNLDAAISAFRNALMSVSQYSLVDVLSAIANIAAATPQDVIDARTSLEGTISDAVVTLTGEVEEGTAAVKGTPGKTAQEVYDRIPTSGWATPTDVDNAETAILEAIDDIPSGTSEYLGPPAWPGLANVTLGSEEALIDQLTITAPMDGVVVNITTPPTKCGRYTIGGAIYDYKVGEVAFESDRGDLEPWQYLGFRQALYTPKTMRRAAKVRFRVLAGASGTCRIWTVT